MSLVCSFPLLTFINLGHVSIALTFVLFSMASNIWLMLSVTSNSPPRTCICTVNSRPQTRALFQPKWTSDNLCNCKRTVFCVQGFLLWGPCLCVKSKISSQIGSSHILSWTGKLGSLCLLLRGDIYYKASSLILFLATHFLIASLLQCSSWSHGWACINHTTQTQGLGKRQTSIKITSYWSFSFHIDGLSHLDNLVASTPLKASQIWIILLRKEEN